MTCFRITRGIQDEQLPLAVGVKNSTFQLLDSRGSKNTPTQFRMSKLLISTETWAVTNYVICEDGNSSPARSSMLFVGTAATNSGLTNILTGAELYEEYLECFRDRINTFSKQNFRRRI